MAAPRRGNTGYSCYFITASTLQKKRGLAVKAQDYRYGLCLARARARRGTSAAKADGFFEHLNRSGKQLRHPKALSSNLSGVPFFARGLKDFRKK